MSTKIIYSMMRVGKIYPPQKQVLRDISLSYFYGAKIGVLGLNGAGKSTLLRIMAGVEKDFVGETTLAPGYTVGYLEQEPQLAAGKTVREIVEEGVQEVVDALREFDEINARFGEPLDADEMDADEPPGRGAGSPRRSWTPGTWTAAWNWRWTRCAARRATRWWTCSPAASGGASPSAACCSRSRTSCCWTSRPTTWTPSRWPGWRSISRSTRARSSPSPTTATSSTTWPAGSWNWIAATASRGGATIPPGWSRSRNAWPRKKKQEALRQKTLQRELEWLHMSPKARQTKRKARINAYNDCWLQDRKKSGPAKSARSSSHPARGWAMSWCAPRTSARPTATTCSTKTSPSTCRRAPSSASSGRTARARRPSSA
jgi:sulfate-transporting ATPase